MHYFTKYLAKQKDFVNTVKSVLILVFLIVCTIVFNTNAVAQSDDFLVDNYHQTRTGWKKSRIGDTKITIESPNDFVLSPRKDLLVGNTVSYKSDSKYAHYILNEQLTLNGAPSLLADLSNQALERFKEKFPSTVLKSSRRETIQGLPALRSEYSVNYSGYTMRVLFLAIQQGKMIWSIQGSSLDEPRANSEVNYVLFTVEITGAPSVKRYPAIVYTFVEKMPELSTGGGLQGIVNEIQKNIKYPLSAFNNNIEGKIFVGFVVNQEGEVVDVKVIKKVEASLDNAAMEAVKKLPKLIPGEQSGKRVYVSFTVPITIKVTGR